MKQEKFPHSNAFILEMKQLNAMKSMTQSRSPAYASKEMGSYCMDSLADGPISYKSDSDMSKDEMIRGLMEISAMSLPEDPHKYYSSHHTCTKTQEPG